MKVLIIGGGGREHALGWKLSQSAKVTKLYFAPGNAGTLFLGENVPINALAFAELFKFAKLKAVDLTIVGPEAALVEGIVDLFTQSGLKIFGPSKAAARLESSKAWAASFMNQHSIPQPKSSVFSDLKQAQQYIQSEGWQNIVIKADGLAAGKGVVVPNSGQEADEALESILVKKIFGQAGEKVVIQERLTGPEVSILAFSDGKTAKLLVSSQDHKRVFDHDKGPNTGGMGTYAPVPFVKDKLLNKIRETIIQPTIDGMRKEGFLYKGILYPGLMLTKSGLRVLEYNARFGDPETQPLMMLLDSDLAKIMIACVEGTLDETEVKFKPGAAVCVVLAAEGYPGKYQKGEVINGLNKIMDSDIQVFHAGTALRYNDVITNGGRVLGITSYGKNIKDALQKVYAVIGKQGINFKGMKYRHDIGKQALTK